MSFDVIVILFLDTLKNLSKHWQKDDFEKGFKLWIWHGSKNGWKKMFTITSAASTIFTRTPFYRVSGFFHSFRFDVLIRFPIHCARKCRFNLKKCWSFSNKSSRDGPRVEVGGRDIFVKEKIEDDSNTHQKKLLRGTNFTKKNS